MHVVIGFVMAVVPFAAIIGAIWLVERRDQWRRDEIDRQIALTNMIHGRLGAIVAPVVTRTLWGRWQIVIAVPFGRSDIVPELMALAQHVVPPSVRRSPRAFRIVLTPQEEWPASARHAPAA